MNSYLCMKRFCELKGIPVPYIHHDWNEAVGYAHLDPVEFWPRRKSPPELSRRTTKPSNDAKQRGPRMDSEALLPTRGKLKRRLDTLLPHVPVKPFSKNATCQLHRWAWKETHPKDKMEGRNWKPPGARAKLLRCETCQVHLCLNCWAVYLNVKYLKQRVFDILGEYEEEELDAAAKRRKMAK